VLYRWWGYIVGNGVQLPILQESLDRERLRLEEVLKAAIEARKSNNKALSDAITGAAAVQQLNWRI